MHETEIQETCCELRVTESQRWQVKDQRADVSRPLSEAECLLSACITRGRYCPTVYEAFIKTWADQNPERSPTRICRSTGRADVIMPNALFTLLPGLLNWA